MYRESAYPNEADVSPRCDLQAAAQKVQKCLLNKPRHPAQLAADKWSMLWPLAANLT